MQSSLRLCSVMLRNRSKKFAYKNFQTTVFGIWSFNYHIYKPITYLLKCYKMFYNSDPNKDYTTN